MSSSAATGTNGATRPYPLRADQLRPGQGRGDDLLRPSIQAVSGESFHQHPPRPAGGVGHQSERRSPRARSRASASACARDRRVTGVEGAVQIEQIGGHGGRWHGCRIRSSPVIVHQLQLRNPCPSSRLLAHAALLARLAPRAAAHIRSPSARPCNTTPSSACFPIGSATDDGESDGPGAGPRGVRLRRHRRRPAARDPGRCDADLLRGHAGVQLAPVSPAAVPGQQRGRGAVPDRPRLEPVSPGGVAGRTGSPRATRSTSWRSSIISAPSPLKVGSTYQHLRATSRPGYNPIQVRVVGRESVTLSDTAPASPACARGHARERPRWTCA